MPGEVLAPTPCVIDLPTVLQRHHELHVALPHARIHYAVKAIPAEPVIGMLADTDIGFDLASTGGIDRCLALGVSPERLCFGNTIKRERDIAWVLLGPVSALVGALIGGSTSLLAAVYSQRVQDRLQRIAGEPFTPTLS